MGAIKWVRLQTGPISLFTSENTTLPILLLAEALVEVRVHMF
jgi:hypothetical protein